MDSGLTFPPRHGVMNPAGTPERSTGGRGGWPSNRVEAPRKGPSRRDGEGEGQPDPESCGVDGQEKLRGERRGVRTGNRHRWVRRAASGERVKRGQGTRHNDPVTSEEGMPWRVTASRPKPAKVAENRPKRLFSKNTGACQAA